MAVAPRVQRFPTAAPAPPSCPSTKQPSPDAEASEQRALHTVQYGLLRILSRTLAALRHFTPDVCQILLDQVPATPALPRSALRQELSGFLAGLRMAPVLPCSPWTLLNTTSCSP